MKKDVVEEGYSPGQVLAAKVLDEVKRRGNGNGSKDYSLVLDIHIVELICRKIHNNKRDGMLERPSTVRKVAKAREWFICEKRLLGSEEWDIKGGAWSKILCTKEEHVHLTPSEMVKMGLKPWSLRDLIELVDAEFPEAAV
jgi:hypothetical protein